MDLTHWGVKRPCAEVLTARKHQPYRLKTQLALHDQN